MYQYCDRCCAVLWSEAQRSHWQLWKALLTTEETMRRITVTDPITLGQQNGVPCPHCWSLQGHYEFCVTTTGQTLVQRFAEAQDNAKQAEAIAEPSLSQEDSLRLKGLGVVWEN